MARTSAMDIVIHYNAEGFEDEALALARRLFAYYDTAIDSLALVPVPDWELDLYLDGQLVRSHRRSGRLPRLADVIEALAST